MELFFKWVAFALFFLLISKIFPGIHVENIFTAFVLAFFWGAMSITLKPIISVLTLPLTLLTFGLFSLVLNGLLFWLLSIFVSGFFVSGFSVAFLGALTLSAFSWFLHVVTRGK